MGSPIGKTALSAADPRASEDLPVGAKAERLELVSITDGRRSPLMIRPTCHYGSRDASGREHIDRV